MATLAGEAALATVGEEGAISTLIPVQDFFKGPIFKWGVVVFFVLIALLLYFFYTKAAAFTWVAGGSVPLLF